MPNSSWYLPPRFPLLEFDEAASSACPADRASARRRLVGFDGEPGGAAREVVLSWRAGSCTVVVATSAVSEARSPQELRHEAARLVGGVTFRARPGDAPPPPGELLDWSDQEYRWLPVAVQVDGVPYGAVWSRRGDLFAGYVETPDVVAAFCLAGVRGEGLRFRVVRSGSGYQADPLAPQTRRDLAGDDLPARGGAATPLTARRAARVEAYAGALFD